MLYSIFKVNSYVHAYLFFMHKLYAYFNLFWKCIFFDTLLQIFLGKIIFSIYIIPYFSNIKYKNTVFVIFAKAV